jgi:hypothetical protein
MDNIFGTIFAILGVAFLYDLFFARPTMNTDTEKWKAKRNVRLVLYVVLAVVVSGTLLAIYGPMLLLFSNVR